MKKAMWTGHEEIFGLVILFLFYVGNHELGLFN